jgi:DNA-binding MarR family transcriptional regulator
MATGNGRAPTVLLDEQAEAIVAASRVLVAVSVESMVAVEEAVTVTQLRALVVIESHRSMNVAELASALGVHASSATRVVDRLLALGLVTRRDNPRDRRHLVLEVTPAGDRLLRSVMRRRQRAVKAILAKVPVEERPSLVAAFHRFAEAGGDVPLGQLWRMAWTS